jgi:multisubunit Na+/H+ antiporter MnhC subunit
MQPSFTYTPCSQMHLNFLYFLSPINFMSSYIFIFHQSIWKMHLNFQIYSCTVNNFFTLLYTLKKNRFAIYFQKIDGALPANPHLLLPHLP